MTLVTLGSVKASPGVSVAALALAATWPGDGQVVLVEADPAGGDLASWYALPSTPGLVSLAAAVRRSGDADVVWQHTQSLPGGMPVVAAPAGPAQARAALRELGPTGDGLLRRWAGDNDMTAVVDCGRLHAGSPALPIWAAGQAVLAVARPNLAELTRLAHALDGLAEAIGESNRNGPGLGLLLVGAGPYQPEEIAAGLRIRVAGVLPADRHAAAVLSGQGGHGAALTARRLAMLPLLRAARGLSRRLAAGLDAAMAQAADDTSEWPLADRHRPGPAARSAVVTQEGTLR